MDPRILAAYLLMREPLMLVGSKHSIDPVWRKCIQCGQPRYHNNSFCSAACCKAYKEKKRNPPTSEASDGHC